MSYEGYVEYLCKNGHYAAFDCYNDPDHGVCDYCHEPYEWRHSVDQTNGICYGEYDGYGEGIGEPHPSTVDGPITEIGFDDEWHTDHHGNKYSRKVVRYKPDETIWRKIGQRP